MNKEQFLASGLLEQHALGITSAEEGELVERYLEAFPDIREDYTAMRKALDQYASQYASQPPEALRSSIMSAVDDEAARAVHNSNDPVPGPGNDQLQQAGWVRYLSYVAIIALAAGLFFVNQKNQSLKQELSASQNQLTLCESEKKSLQESSNLYAFLAHGATEQIRLTSTAADQNIAALAYWNPQEKKAFFNPLQLPATPEGKQYQIWADVRGEMISVGLLDDNFQTGQLASINYIADATSLNVTIEPKGGSEHPTVETLLVNGSI